MRRKLVAATIELMSERSPALITNRQIAARAGVNHGQIHHYFDSKDDLIAKAIAHQAEWFVRERLSGIEDVPIPIDTGYRFSIWRALAYLAVHSEELEYVSPLIAHLVRAEAARRGVAETDGEVLADVAAIMALSYGWSVFQDHLIRSLEPFDVDADALRSAIAERSRRLVAE